jgi:hypothetical protein
VCQSHTGRLTGFWFLLNWPKGWILMNEWILDKNFMFCWPCIPVKSCKQSQLGARFFLVCLFLFSTCFRWLCAHHQEKQLYLCDTWYLLFWNIYPCNFKLPTCFRIRSTMCHITNTVVFPDDGHIVAWNIKEINILRKTVHQVGFIYKIRQEYLKQNAEFQYKCFWLW